MASINYDYQSYKNNKKPAIDQSNKKSALKFTPQIKTRALEPGSL